MFLSAIFIYIVVGSLCIVSLRYPFVGIAGYYALSFFRPQDVFWYSLQGSRLSYYVAAITIASTLFHLGKRDKEVKRVNEFFWFFILFYLAALHSFIFAEDKLSGYPWFILFSKMMLMSIVTLLVVENIRQLRILILMLVAIFCFLALRGNYQYFFQGVWQLEPPGEPGLPPFDNNYFAMLFVMVIPLAFFLFFTERKPIWWKWGPPSTIPFMIHAVILTYSRGGFLGMVAVLANCVLFLKQRRWAILAGLLILISVLRLQGEMSRQRMTTIYTYEEDISVRSRFEAWRAAENMMFQRPWTGVGIGNFETHAPLYNPRITVPRAAHNAFLHVGGEMGIIGFVLYAGILVIAFYRLWRIRRFYKPTYLTSPHYYYATALQTSLIGFTVCAMFLSLNYLELYYFFLLLIALLTNIYRRDLRQRESIVKA